MGFIGYVHPFCSLSENRGCKKRCTAEKYTIKVHQKVLVWFQKISSTTRSTWDAVLLVIRRFDKEKIPNRTNSANDPFRIQSNAILTHGDPESSLLGPSSGSFLGNLEVKFWSTFPASMLTCIYHLRRHKNFGHTKSQCGEIRAGSWPYQRHF